MAKKLNVKRLNIVGHQGNSNKKHHEVFITHEQLRTVSRAERQASIATFINCWLAHKMVQPLFKTLVKHTPTAMTQQFHS